MNVRSLVALSVLMNVALVVVGWRTGRSPVSATGMTAEPSAPSGVLRVKTSLTRVELTETNEAAPFHWREVQAEDLKEFVANLRGLGCPPETVRAIIESELWRRFLPLRRTLLEPFHRQFWELAAAIPNSEKAWEPIKQSMLALKAETLGKLDEIVGLEPAKRSRNPNLDFLSEEKQRALLRHHAAHGDEEQFVVGDAERAAFCGTLRRERFEIGNRHAVQHGSHASLVADKLSEIALAASSKRRRRLARAPYHFWGHRRSFV